MAKHLRHARCLLFYLVFIVSTLFSNSKSLQSIVFYLLCIAISCNPKLFHSIQLQRANTGDVFKRITGRIPLARVSSSFFAWGERNLSLLYGNHFRLEDHKSWTPHSIFQRISNASGQCAVPHHYARSFPVKASPDFATHEFQPLLPPFVPQRFLLLINRRDWNSRYLDIFSNILSNNWTNFHFWKLRGKFLYYSFFTRWLKSQSARKFIYLHPSLVIFSTNYIIEVYLRDDIRTISGEGISGWKIYTRGESKSLWLEMNDGSPATLASGMVAKAVHGRRIPSCRTIPKEV